MSSRAYRIRPDRPLPGELARIARGRIEHALEELLGKSASTPEEAVHEARKDMKKLRALLRLARAELGEETFRRENVRFRDAARELAGVRDADVMLATLAKLEPPGGTQELRARLEAHRARDGSGDRSAGDRRAALRAVALLEEALPRVRGWPLERDSFAALAGGLELSYGRGRREQRALAAEPTTEGLHEWRKRVKELWYHQTLLRELWPPVMAATGDEAHELADLLGDDHDLAVLRDWIDEHATELAPPGLLAAVDDRRADLQARSLRLGALVYAEKPEAYRRRLRRLWKACRGAPPPARPATSPARTAP